MSSIVRSAAVCLLVVGAIAVVSLVTHLDYTSMVAGAALWLAIRADDRARAIANVVSELAGVTRKLAGFVR